MLKMMFVQVNCLWSHVALCRGRSLLQAVQSVLQQPSQQERAHSWPKA